MSRCWPSRGRWGTPARASVCVRAGTTQLPYVDRAAVDPFAATVCPSCPELSCAAACVLTVCSDKVCSACPNGCSDKYVNIVGEVPKGVPSFQFPGTGKAAVNIMSPESAAHDRRACVARCVFVSRYVFICSLSVWLALSGCLWLLYRLVYLTLLTTLAPPTTLALVSCRLHSLPW